MKTRDDHRFVLLPWEHRGADFDARPDAITSIQFAGAERVVLLKARADRLFFKFADWFLDEWREFVFAVTLPFSSPIADAEEFFHAAMEQKQIARYVIHDYTHQIQGHTAILWLFNDNSDKQTGWAREWCGGDWILFEDELPRYMSHSIWDEKWHLSLGMAMYQSVWPTLARRRFPLEERQNVPVRWVRGSREELSRLLRAYFRAFPEAARKVNEHLEEWGEYGSTGDTQVRMWAWNAGASGISLRGTMWNNSPLSDQTHCDLFRHISSPWKEILVKHNHAIGLTWHHNEKGDVSVRENWWYETPIFDLDVPLPFPLPFTQHEQLEARLELHEWLRDKAPQGQIETWLNST